MNSDWSDHRYDTKIQKKIQTPFMEKTVNTYRFKQVYTPRSIMCFLLSVDHNSMAEHLTGRLQV